MLDASMLSFVRGSLPPPPRRVLEVGAGKGELAAALAAAGYDVVAIDPAAAESAGADSVAVDPGAVDPGAVDPGAVDPGMVERVGTGPVATEPGTLDQAPEGTIVRPVALHMLDEPRASFDAAVAVLSMHHVDPLADSCRRLAEMVKPGGTLVLDEIDFARFDERAAAWWLEQHGPDDDGGGGGVGGGGGHAGAGSRGGAGGLARVGGHGNASPEEIVQDLRQHCHELDMIRRALEEWFELGPTARGPYLYRWELSPDLRESELELIAAGALPATGARIVGTRR